MDLGSRFQKKTVLLAGPSAFQRQTQPAGQIVHRDTFWNRRRIEQSSGLVHSLIESVPLRLEYGKGRIQERAHGFVGRVERRQILQIRLPWIMNPEFLNDWCGKAVTVNRDEKRKELARRSLNQELVNTRLWCPRVRWRLDRRYHRVARSPAGVAKIKGGKFWILVGKNLHVDLRARRQLRKRHLDAMPRTVEDAAVQRLAHPIAFHGIKRRFARRRLLRGLRLHGRAWRFCRPRSFHVAEGATGAAVSGCDVWLGIVKEQQATALVEGNTRPMGINVARREKKRQRLAAEQVLQNGLIIALQNENAVRITHHVHGIPSRGIPCRHIIASGIARAPAMP